MPPEAPRHWRVVRPDVPLSALQQRLQYMDRRAERRFVSVIENVPVWPHTAGAPATTWAQVRGYAPARGHAPLLARLAARSSRGARAVAPEEVVVTHGAMHALSLLFRLHARPGALALCQAPALAAIPAMLRSYGYRPQLFTAPDGQLDLDALRRHREVGLIYVNTPHNPSGDVLSSSALAQLIELASDRGAPLIVDMVYDDFVFTGAAVPSPLELTAELRQVHVVNSMSKNFGAPGLRVGWVVSARANVERLAEMLEQENIAVGGPAQGIAEALICEGNAALVEAVTRGRRLLGDRLAAVNDVSWAPPAAGCQVWLELPVADIEDFCDFALVEFGLGLTSASNYAGVSGARLRLPLGAPEPVLNEAVGLLADALRAYPGAAP